MSAALRTLPGCPEPWNARQEPRATFTLNPRLIQSVLRSFYETHIWIINISGPVN